MKFNFINGWKSKAKQEDKVQIKLRISKVTVINIQFDLSKKALRLEIANLGIEIGGNKKEADVEVKVKKSKKTRKASGKK